MKTIFKIVKLAFAYPAVTFRIILFDVLYVIFELVSLAMFVPFLKIIFKVDEETAKEVVKPVLAEWTPKAIADYLSDTFTYYQFQFIEQHGEMGALVFVCVVTGIAFFLKNASKYATIWNHSYLRMAIVRDFRHKMYERLLRLPLSFYSEEKKGDLISAITNDIKEIEDSVVTSLEFVFREPLRVFLFFGYLFYISPSLTLFSIIILPVTGLILSKLGKALKRESLAGQNTLGQLISHIEESISGLRIVKIFDKTGTSEERFDELNEKHRKIITGTFRKKGLASPLSEFLSTVILMVIVYYGGSLILGKQEGALSGSNFIMFILLFSQLMRPIQNMSLAVANAQKGQASLIRFDKIIEAEPEKETGNKDFKLDKSFRFENVSFEYVEGRPVLKNINFELAKGKSLALVGLSGSGKSTIADLIPRFYNVKSGKILCDNISINDIKLEELRGNIAYVSQAPILFNATVYENVTFGIPNVTQEQVVEACKMAHAMEFIDELPQRFETPVGDGGGKLSGGQKQRISIARAILKNADLLILDEATSALDSESEKKVQLALDELMKDRTSIVIAHRLSTIKHADQILVIDRGEVVEQGTHLELVSLDNQYANLVKQQGL